MSTSHNASETRLSIIRIAMILWIAAIGAKLLWLQVKQHDWLQARAAHQQQAAIDLSPMRGIIFDRNGDQLARSVAVKSLYASPADITDPAAAADTLSDVLDIDRDDLYKRLTSARAAVAVKPAIRRITSRRRHQLVRNRERSRPGVRDGAMRRRARSRASCLPERLFRHEPDLRLRRDILRSADAAARVPDAERRRRRG